MVDSVVTARNALALVLRPIIMEGCVAAVGALMMQQPLPNPNSTSTIFEWAAVSVGARRALARP